MRPAPAFDATEGRLRLPDDGLYEAWLAGSVRGSATLLVDGREVGETRHELESDADFIPLGRAHLDKGVHETRLELGGADLHPGSGGVSSGEADPLLFTPAGALGSLSSCRPSGRDASVVGAETALRRSARIDKLVDEAPGRTGRPHWRN